MLGDRHRRASLSRRDSDKKLIARDAKNVPLVSTFAWTDDAAQRVLRVPAGFMRNRTQDRIEAMAAERVVDDDRPRPRRGRDRDTASKLMAEMLASQAAATPHTGLNEVGTMSAMAAERAELKNQES